MTSLNWIKVPTQPGVYWRRVIFEDGLVYSAGIAYVREVHGTLCHGGQNGQLMYPFIPIVADKFVEWSGPLVMPA